MADKIKAGALTPIFEGMADWGYIYGKRGQVWTQAQQDAATRAQTKQYGQKWVGRQVADCSGAFVYAYQQHGHSIYHGSDTIYRKYCSKTGPVAGRVKICQDTAVFQVEDGRRVHIGLYVGNGLVREQRGTKAGHVVSPLSAWDEWGRLSDVDYTDAPPDVLEIVPTQTVRRGDKGELVRYIQAQLNADPRYPTAVDGIFGRDTESSVRAYQYDHGLASDGVVGPKTWAKIVAGSQENPSVPDGDSSPTQGSQDDAESLPIEVEQSETNESDCLQSPSVASPELDSGLAEPGEVDSPQGEDGEVSPTVEERLTRLEAAVFGEGGGESDG